MDATLEIVPLWWALLRRKIMDSRMRPLIRSLFSCKIIFYFLRMPGDGRVLVTPVRNAQLVIQPLSTNNIRA